jgi:hypothetical protein
VKVILNILQIGKSTIGVGGDDVTTSPARPTLTYRGIMCSKNTPRGSMKGFGEIKQPPQTII